MSAVTWVAFLVAAGIGAPARYVVDSIVQDRTEGVYPLGTLVVNVTGCLVLGVITGLAMYHGLGGSAKTVLGTGSMGAYTTFSTFTFETVRLVEEGAGRHAVRNVAASVVFGLAAAALGIAVTAW